MAADGNWCTPPDSPSTAHRGVVSSSYEHAIQDNDWYWDWQHETQIQRSPPIATPPVGQVSVPPPAHVMSSDQIYQGKLNQDSGINSMTQKDFDNVPNNNILVAASSPTSVGFTPAYPTHYDTTQISSLPGAQKSSSGNDSVVLQPPTSHGKVRSTSIEEAGKKLAEYAPAKKGEGIMHPEAIPGCLTYLMSYGEQSDTQDGSILTKEDDDLLRMEDSFEDSLTTITDDVTIVNPYEQFSHACSCYDMMPDSIKMVVLDKRLPMRKAFFALVQNGVRAAPVWDSNIQEFVGMLTISDFVNVLIFHYKSPIVEMDEFEEQTIQMWRESVKQVADLKPTLIRIDPKESLYKAVEVLVRNKIHRLPVIDYRTGDAVYIMTHKRLLHYICMHLLDGSQPTFMDKSLRELGIGTYNNIATATRDTPLIVALKIFAERRISALPIVDECGVVVDIYAKFDVINLAAERTYNNLDISIHRALQHRAEGFEGVHTCQLFETFHVIVKRFVSTQVHRLVVVDTDKHVIGVLSLSDLLSFLILHHHTDST
ncbi:5'-AMP-activated protein kinase subunit gamma-1-like isoform X2 [Dysidea avara]|uniref:5'-AMP-activated protein kinase subunit gamma-1-like isoform X2 n=1 Tax=Dysidea avara TaxID=196820 RepID=UPI003319E88A